MKIEEKKVVVMTYELEVEGKIVDKAGEKQPLDYIQGTSMLIPKLEKTVEGKSEGETFECTVSPEEGYGEYDLKKVFDIPKESFMINGEIRDDLLEIGRFIPMLNSAGEVCQGMIVEIKEKDVTMDFNPPMAGKTLHFTGKILEVRDATEKELTEGLHGEYLPHDECGCGCGCGHHHGEGHCHENGEGHCHHHEGEEGCCGKNGHCDCNS